LLLLLRGHKRGHAVRRRVNSGGQLMCLPRARRIQLQERHPARHATLTAVTYNTSHTNAPHQSRVGGQEVGRQRDGLPRLEGGQAAVGAARAAKGVAQRALQGRAGTGQGASPVRARSAEAAATRHLATGYTAHAPC
jgi:hypothetical protein